MENNCPNCNSQNVIFSKKRQIYLCEDCGYEFKEMKQFTPLRIFLSYGRDDFIKFAKRLKKDLENRGHYVWFDEEKIKTGSDWEQYIEKGLEWVSKDISTGRLIFIITPHSARRPDGYCLNEIARAIMRSIPIIPVMLVYAEPPLSICRIQYLNMQDCFPPDEKHVTYEQKFNRLISALEDNKIDFEGFQSKLLSTLQPIKFQADIFKLTRDFTGREWAIKAIDDWFNDPNGSKIFWIVGKPGSGKSALSAWIQENRREIVAHHFCDINSEEKRDPCKLVKSIAYQLSTQLPAYEEKLKAIQLESVISEYKEAYTLFDKLIVQPLSDGFLKPDRTLVVLIDAIDEATYQNKNEIAKFLSRCADKTPKWLRFLITSRPEQEITTELQALSPYVLDTTTEENKEDLRQYIKKQIPEITPQQIEEIINIGEGLFLYVKHVCEEIKAGKLSLDRIDKFPQGLGGMYKQFFDNRFSNNLDFYKKEIRKLLCLIFASFEPLTLGHLKELLKKDNLMELFDITDTLGSLFPRSGGKENDIIKPFHRSIKDWITDKDKSGVYYVDESHGHKILAEEGFRQYSENVEMMNDYYLEWLPMHLIVAQKYKEAVELLKDFNYMMVRLKAGHLERLINDYLNGVSLLPKDVQDKLSLEVAFFREKAHILRRGNSEWPSYKILFQLAIEHADDSPLTLGAEKYLEEGKVDWLWLKSIKRPAKVKIDPCIAVFEGHSGSIYGAIELNDERILSWSDDSTLRIWNNDGKQLKILGGLGFIEQAIELSDGRIVSTHSDGTLKIWSNNGELIKTTHGYKALDEEGYLKMELLSNIRELNGHVGTVKGVLELKDGQILSWGWDGTLRLWDNQGNPILDKDGKPIIFVGHKDMILGAIQLRNKRILSWSRRGDIIIWDNLGNKLKILEGHKKAVNGALELKDGRILSWADDRCVKFWDKDGNPIANPEFKDIFTSEEHIEEIYDCTIFGFLHDSPVTQAIELSDGRILTCTRDGWLRLFDSEGNFLKVINEKFYSIYEAIELKDGRILTWSNNIHVWNNNFELIQVIKGHTYRIRGAIELKDGTILTWSDDKILKKWDILLNTASTEIIDGHRGSIVKIIPLKENKILSLSRDKSFRIWDKDGNSIKVVNFQRNFIFACLDAIELDDNEILLCTDGSLQIYDFDGNIIKILDGHTDTLRGVTKLKDGRILSWSQDKTLIIWDKNGNPMKTLEGHTGVINGAIELSDGKILSWSQDETLRLWDNSGEPMKEFEGHKNAIDGAIELTSGEILSWAGDKIFRLWDRNGNIIKIIQGPDDLVTKAIELKDGRILFWSYFNDTLGILNINNGDISECEINPKLLELFPEGFTFKYGASKLGSRFIFKLGNYFLFSQKSNLCLFNKVLNKSCYWHGTSEFTFGLIKSDGNVVVGQENGQINFLRLYKGNVIVDINELEKF